MKRKSKSRQTLTKEDDFCVEVDDIGGRSEAAMIVVSSAITAVGGALFVALP